jgi:phage shock protein C
MKKRLYKSDSKMLCGVCGGIAEYFDLDPTLVRLCWAFLTLFTCAFPGIILYAAAAIIMPQKPQA